MRGGDSPVFRYAAYGLRLGTGGVHMYALAQVSGHRMDIVLRQVRKRRLSFSASGIGPELAQDLDIGTVTEIFILNK